MFDCPIVSVSVSEIDLRRRRQQRQRRQCHVGMRMRPRRTRRPCTPICITMPSIEPSRRSGAAAAAARRYERRPRRARWGSACRGECVPPAPAMAWRPGEPRSHASSHFSRKHAQPRPTSERACSAFLEDGGEAGRELPL